MSKWGVRHVIMAEYPDACSYPRRWVPVVVESIPKRYWRVGSVIGVKAERFMCGGPLADLRDPHIAEVAGDDPLLLGPFNQYGPDGVQHYPTFEAAKRNFDRLLLLMAKKKICLRSSVAERPLRKRQVEGSSPSGGSKWIRRLEYQMAQNERQWRNFLDKHPESLWAAHQLAKKRGSPA